MHLTPAGGATRPEIPSADTRRNIFSRSVLHVFGSATAEAKHLIRRTRGFPARIAVPQKIQQVLPLNQDWPLVVHGVEPRLEPGTNGIFVNFQKIRSFIHRVGPMDFDAPRIDTLHESPGLSRKRLMSSARHAVIRGPSFTGLGYRPDLTPDHQVDFETGTGPFGARISDRRTKPVCGNEKLSCMVFPNLRCAQHAQPQPSE